jgi:hypothetical protein
MLPSLRLAGNRPGIQKTFGVEASAGHSLSPYCNQNTLIYILINLRCKQPIHHNQASSA